MDGPPLMRALILWFIRIGKDLHLEGRHVVIKLHEMGGKHARLGFFAGFVVKEDDGTDELSVVLDERVSKRRMA
jgi:hypothetical protein